MRNRTRYILALGALSAVCCAANVASVDEDSNWRDALASSVALAQDDDFDLDTDEEDSGAFEDEGETDGEDADDSFGSKTSADPFAPSDLSDDEPASAAPVKKNDDKADEAPVDEEAAKRAEERAKYNRPEDVPDELKTEEDYFATMSAPEKSILYKTPQNAAEWLAAAVKVARVGRANFAKLLVDKALQAPDATPEESAKALDELGMGRAVAIVANPEIGPKGSEAYEKVFAVAQKYWGDETTIREALKSFADESVATRANAIAELRKGGATAMTIVIADLIGADAEASKTAQKAASFFEADGIDALIATLPNVQGDALIAVVGALGDATDKRIGPELAAQYYAAKDAAAGDAFVEALSKQYRELPQASEILVQTYEKALGFYKRAELFPNALDNEATIWRWDAEKGLPVQETVPLEEAYREEAARLSTAARGVAMKLENVPTAIESLAIAANAERDLYRGGVDGVGFSRDSFQLAFRNDDASDFLAAIEFALDSRRFKGAILPTVVLRDFADESLLAPKAGEQSVLVRAATAPDRRLRYEALWTIAEINPTKPYLGSSRVVEGLKWFATATDAKYVVIASPKLDETSKIGQFYAQQGYKIIPVVTGRDALLAAQANADVEFVLATASINQPNILTIAQALRADVRTCDVPLMVGADNDRQKTAANVSVGSQPNAYVVPTPFDLESASWALQNLFDVVDCERVPVQIRIGQAKWAARTLLQLSQTRPNLYEIEDLNDMTRRFLASPNMFNVGLEYAATIRTNYAQNALVDLIGDVRLDVQTRRAVLKAFENQLKANGSLLRGPDVKKMYDRYNASEKEDAESQKVLSDMLDVYEKATE